MLATIGHGLAYVIPWIAVLLLVVTVHELGHFLVGRAVGARIDRFSIGFGRPLARWTDRHGCEWRVGWILLGGYVKFAGDAEASSSVPDGASLAALRRRIVLREGVGAERRYMPFKPVWQRALIVAAGPFANFVLSTALFALLLMTVGVAAVKPRVGSVLPGSVAAAAGFRPGDLVTAANGRKIGDFRDLAIYVSVRSGESIRFDVQRGGRAMQLVATPRAVTSEDKVAGAATMGKLGVGSSREAGDVTIRRYAPLEALGGGAARTWSVLDTTLHYLKRVALGLESGDQFGGPLRTLKVTGAAAAAGAEGAHGWAQGALGAVVGLMGIAAILSVGIGFMNLLPVPVLDGGHLLFYAYEAVARRPLPAAVQAVGYRVGLVLLLGFMLFATWNDLQRLSVFKHLGGLFS